MNETTQEILVIMAISILLIVVIWWKFRTEILLALFPMKAEGTIVNWMSTQEGGKIYFYPIVEFFDVAGTRYSYRAAERCEERPMYYQGTKVMVKYLQKDPTKVKTIYPVG